VALAGFGSNNLEKTMNIVVQKQNESANLATEEQGRVQYATPLVDVESTEEGYTIRAEMPGVEKSGLEITVDNGELTILGHRKANEAPGEPVYREIRNNDFRRVYELDPAIDTGKISARIDQGILTLTLPKAESVKPRKIAVD
jgi:HSP20 family protein